MKTNTHFKKPEKVKESLRKEIKKAEVNKVDYYRKSVDLYVCVMGCVCLCKCVHGWTGVQGVSVRIGQ